MMPVLLRSVAWELTPYCVWRWHAVDGAAIGGEAGASHPGVSTRHDD